MKHIKTYENLLVKQEYQIGDYVLLLEDANRRTWNVDLHCKIIDVENKIGYRTESIGYKIRTFYTNDHSEAKVWIDQKEIERKLTPKEIEEYKLKEEAKKYNI